MMLPDALFSLCIAFGVYVSAKLTCFASGIIYCKFLASPLDVSKLGRWAVVTGATDGIGKAYAMQLAEKGLDVVLVSRTPVKLQHVATEIESKFGVKTKVVVVNFTADYKSYCDKLEEELGSLDIGVLVNNVGMCYEYIEEFLEVEGGLETFGNLVNVNITSLNVMTYLVLPGMVKRGKGAVVNISSISAEVLSPLISVYAATKAYVDKLSDDLEMEYSPKGITVQCVLPGLVVSNMSRIRRAKAIAPMPEAFVRSALSRLGVTSHTSGYWSHDLKSLFLRTAPKCLVRAMTMRKLYAFRDWVREKKNKDRR